MARLDLTVNVNTRGADSLQNVGRQLQGVGKGMTIGLTLPIVAAGAAFTNMAIEAEEAQSKVDSAFASMNAGAWTSIDALNQTAEAWEGMSTFAAEDVKQLQAVLLTFGNVTGDAFDQATEAALNMSTLLGQDVQQSAIQVGKALNDPIAGIGALRRVGVQLTEQQEEMIRSFMAVGDIAGAQGVILGELERQFGDAAVNMGETTRGQLVQAMNALGAAGESMAVLLLPALTGLAQGLKSVAGWFTSLDPVAKSAIAAIVGIVAIVGPVLWVAGTVIANFKAIGAAFGVLKVLLLANPFVALAAAVVALVALVVLNWEKIVNVFRGALQFIGSVGKRLWTPVADGFTAAIDVIRGAWNAFARWWNSINISVPSFDVPFVGTVGGFSIGLPNLPMLAEGGIVNSPTLALIGESGPEAVVPLDRYTGAGPQVNINVANDDRDLERRIADTIDRMFWTQGIDVVEPV